MARANRAGRTLSGTLSFRSTSRTRPVASSRRRRATSATTTRTRGSHRSTPPSCRRNDSKRTSEGLGGNQPSLPSSLDDDDRHVVYLGVRGPLADLVQEGGNDVVRWLVTVCPDHFERATNAEARASA